MKNKKVSRKKISEKNCVSCSTLHASRFKAFTLLELLLVTGLLLVISVPAAAFSTRFIYQSAVRDAKEGLAGMIREAQVSAGSGKKNSSWGVAYFDDRLVMFSGDSYVGRDPALDQPLAVSSGVEISGFSETVFSRPDGIPDHASSVTLSRGNISETLSLNSEGVVE